MNAGQCAPTHACYYFNGFKHQIPVLVDDAALIVLLQRAVAFVNLFVSSTKSVATLSFTLMMMWLPCAMMCCVPTHRRESACRKQSF